jgi:hypothetical protein
VHHQWEEHVRKVEEQLIPYTLLRFEMSESDLYIRFFPVSDESNPTFVVEMEYNSTKEFGTYEQGFYEFSWDSPISHVVSKVYEWCFDIGISYELHGMLDD